MNGRVIQIAPGASCTRLLPGYTFGDSYRIGTLVRDLDAREAMAAIFRSSPLWVDALMTLRNRIARLVGLRTVKMGAFPLLEEGPERVVLGLDDRHLDFRVAIAVSPGRGEARYSQVTVTTLVRLNNLMGRVYLASVLPFHRRIVRTTLANAVFA